MENTTNRTVSVSAETAPKKQTNSSTSTCDSFFGDSLPKLG